MAAARYRRRQSGGSLIESLPALAGIVAAAPRVALLQVLGGVRRRVAAVAPWRFRERLLRGRERTPPVGRVHLGDLNRLTPISSSFGFDRGLPIDRYYIERFLARHASEIVGRVLEIGDDTYTRRFGGSRVTRSDVLHVHAGNTRATFVGDLTDPDVLPENAFDCIVLTQTLQLIFDVPLAIRRVHRALAPGGVVLVTAPGISQIDRGEWGSTWFWSFTPAALERLFGEVFGTSRRHDRASRQRLRRHGLSAGPCRRGGRHRRSRPHRPRLPGHHRAARAQAGRLTCAACSHHRSPDSPGQARGRSSSCITASPRRQSIPGAWRCGPTTSSSTVSILARTRRPLLMSEFVDRLDRGVLPDDAVAVTFDDGYVDNLCEAKPRLEAEGVPATIFVATGALGQRTEYWWDELARLILLRRAALDCQLIDRGRVLSPRLRRRGDEPNRAWRGVRGSHHDRRARRRISTSGAACVSWPRTNGRR